MIIQSNALSFIYYRTFVRVVMFRVCATLLGSPTRSGRQKGKAMSKQPKKKKTAKEWLKYLVERRDTWRLKNKKSGVKQPYNDKGAEVLFMALVKALTLPAITPEQARDGKNVVVLDMRKVVRHVTPNLWKRPDITLLQRMAVIEKYAPNIKGKVAWARYLSSPKHPNCNPNHDDAYKVILFSVK